MSPGPKKKFSAVLAVRLDPELRKRLEEVAQGEERTASQMARIFIREGIETRGGGKKPKRTTP